MLIVASDFVGSFYACIESDLSHRTKQPEYTNTFSAYCLLPVLPLISVVCGLGLASIRLRLNHHLLVHHLHAPAIPYRA